MKKLLAAAVAALLALAGPARADQGYNAFIIGAPPDTSPTGSELVGCITGGVTKQCTISGIAGKAPVASVFGRTGAVSLLAPDIGSVLAFSAPTHQFLASLSVGGGFGAAQPGIGDLANVSGSTFLCNNTGVSGPVLACSQAQATALLNPFSATLQGLVPASGGGTVNFMRADGQWATPAGGGNVSGPVSSVNNDVVTWNLTTGTIIKDSGIAISSLLTGNQTITLSGDAAGSGATAIAVTNTKINGTSVPAAPAVHQTLVVTAPNVGSYKTIPACTDTAGNHLNYDQTTDTYSCGTSSSSGGVINSGAAGQLGYYAATGTAISPATVGSGLQLSAGTLTTHATDSTHVTSATVANIGGIDNFNGASITATLPGTGTIGSGQTAIIANQNATTLTITDSQTVNGLPLATALHFGGFYGYAGNGTSADAIGFPGFGTITTNALAKYLDGTGASTTSSISDAGSGVTVGSPTGGAEGAGTLNATGLFVNGVAVSTGGATPLSAGTSITLTAPRGYAVCTTTCTITVPVPAAGDEFCVMNDDNVSTVITLAAIGASARYENTARTAYGTAGTGTLVSGGAVGDKVCIVGRDATHYLTTSFNGTWTAS
jgi:hypothetical protein